jgi:hypothetical protein
MSRHRPGSRKKNHSAFESGVFWLGMILVLAFLAWTIVMVLFQAFTHFSH